MRRIPLCSIAGSSSLICLMSASLMASTTSPLHDVVTPIIHVMNCNDSGVGSLRSSVATAHSGDTIDLSTAPCSRIVLTSGQIVVTQNDMTLIGPGRLKLALDGNHASRVFMHVGGGKLTIKSMSIANGYFTLPRGNSDGPPQGGCVKSDSDIELNAVDLHDCLVEEIPFVGRGEQGGGGVYAGGALRIINSNVCSNTARAGEGGGAYAVGNIVVYRSRICQNSAFTGGGLMSGPASSVTISYSTVDSNTVSRIDAEFGPGGGGIYVYGKLVVNKSTVSRNRAIGGYGGGAVAFLTYIYDSTFSGNEAADTSAIITEDRLSISNSTIAFNWSESPYSTIEAAVVNSYGGYNIHSSIIARNRAGTGEGFDIGGFAPYVHGANNLIEKSQIPLPPDTISANPLLAPLANNGGPTRTHALLNGSPAIDRGSNLRHRLYDQRGPGFSRVKGAAPDIGAFEH